MQSLSRILIMCGLAYVADAAHKHAGPFGFKNFNARPEAEPKEQRSGRIATKLPRALLTAGLTSAGVAGFRFARRAVAAKRAKSIARASQSRAFAEGRIKGGKSNIKPAEATRAHSSTTKEHERDKHSGMADRTKSPMTETKAATPVDAGSSAGHKEEEEQVYDVQRVNQLDASNLSPAQLEHPYARLLGPKLVRYDSLANSFLEVATADVLDGKTTALFFHAQQVEEMLDKMNGAPVLPAVQSVYGVQKALATPFEMVFVSLPDGQEGRFQDYVKRLPFSAIPFNSTEQASLFRALKVQSLPSAVILDERAQVINPKGFTYMLSDPRAFPWRPKSTSQMLGDSFVNNRNETVLAAQVGKRKILGIYFSAQWCKPCQAFTPQLIAMYHQLKAQGKDLEIIFVSSDESEAKFHEYFAEMPWLAMPYGSPQTRALLMQELEVRGLPTLVLLDEERNVITSRGREYALKDSSGLKFPWHPEPLNEVSYTVEGIVEKPSVLVFMEGANPQEQDRIQQDLQRVADETVRQAKVEPDEASYQFHFYYAKEPSAVAKALRSIVGLPEVSVKDKFLVTKQEINRPRMALFDIQSQEYFISEEEINEASIRSVMSCKVLGDLEMTPFPRAEQGSDSSPQSSV